MDIIEIAVPELGNRSYVLMDDGEAVVIDPPRHPPTVLRILDEHDARARWVLETHVHNDFVSGGLDLAYATGATYAFSAEDHVRFPRRGLQHEETIAVGNARLTAIATPGHTPTHLSYIATPSDRPAAVFTGGSILFGSVGRTDLFGAEQTNTLALAQHASAHALSSRVHDDATIHPTHGFGSLCSAGPAHDARSATIGELRRTNPVLIETDAARFARALVDGFGDVPAYYRHAAAHNRTGPPPSPSCTPQPLTVDALALARDARATIVDIRPRTDFAREHLAGSINVELRDSFAVTVGRVVGWLEPLVLLGEAESDCRDAARMLELIGRDDVVAAFVGGPDRWPDGTDVGSLSRVTFTDLLAAGDVPVLDVRERAERTGGAVPGSMWCSLDRLAFGPRPAGVRFDGVPTWVHCASGFRAAVAASMLLRQGHGAVLVDGPVEVPVAA